MVPWLLAVGLMGCTPALILEGRRASESGDWVGAHQAYQQAAARYPKHPEYREMAADARPRAQAQLVDEIGRRLDERAYDQALSLVDDALRLGDRSALEPVRPRFAAAVDDALARGDAAKAFERIGTINGHFPGAIEPAPAHAKIRAWIGDESKRRIAAGKLADAVAIWDIAAANGLDVAKSRAQSQADAAAWGLAASKRAFEAGQGDRGLALWDEARAVAPTNSSEGTGAPFPGLFLAAGRASADGLVMFDWAARIEARFPGRPEATTLRGEGRQAVGREVDALVARRDYDAAIARPGAAREKDPSFDWRPVDDRAREMSAAALVDAARAEAASGRADAAVTTLERAASFRPPRGLVRPGDSLPVALASEGGRRLARSPVEAYDLGARLLAVFPGNPSVVRLLDQCHDGLRESARRAYFEARIPDAEAIFARIARAEPAVDVGGWRAQARGEATGDALALAVRTVDAGDPVMSLGWVDLARRIGGDTPTTRVLWDQAVTRLYGAAPRVVGRQGPAAGYELVRDLDERFPGSIQSGAATRGVREASFDAARRAGDARQWDVALATLEAVRKYEPAQAYSVDLERGHILDRWSGTVADDARGAWMRHDVGSAWVLIHRADGIAGRVVNPNLERSLAQDLAAQGPEIGWTLTGARGTLTERAWLGALVGGPSLRIRPGAPGLASGTLKYQGECRTVVTSQETATHQYLGAPTTQANPDWQAADREVRDAEARRVAAESKGIPAAKARAESARQANAAAVAARGRADASLDAAEMALIEAKTAVGVAEARVAESEAAAARVASATPPTEADRAAAQAAVEAAKKVVEAARVAQKAAGEAWRAIQPGCVAGTTDPTECAAKREASKAAREVSGEAMAALNGARANLTAIEAAMSGGSSSDAVVAAELPNRRAALDAAKAALVPVVAGFDRAKAAVRDATEALVRSEAAVREADKAVRDAVEDGRKAAAARDAAITRRDSLPKTVVVRPTLTAPYAIDHVARVCSVEVQFSGSTPSGRPMPPNREEARDVSVAVHGNPAIDLPAKIPSFGRDDLARLKAADAVVGDRLAGWTRSEIEALRGRWIADASQARDPDDATTKWLVAFWLDPKRQPEGMDRFFARQWPDVPISQLAP